MSIDQNGGRALRPEQPNSEGVLQRKARGEGVDDMAVAHAGFAGQATEVPYRAEMEAGFGVDFGGVQAFTGGDAAQASQALGAEAYTVGQNVAFADASPGKDVVAHELAHTIQQGGGASSGAVQTFGGEGGYEAEADDAAATVLAGGKAEVNLRTGSSVQRWGGSDHYHIGNLAGQKALAKVRQLGINPKTKEVDIAHPDKPGTGQDGRSDIANPTKGETVDVNTGKTWGGLGSEGHISFGAATRYGGDYVTTADGLRAQTNEADLRLAWDTAEMIGGAATNSNHFYPLNQTEYRGHHARAMAAAAKGDMSTALIEEGFANHFLADTFASGHTVPRSLDSVEALHNEDTSVILTAALVPGGAVGPFAENGIKGLTRSKSWHDFFCALPDGLPFSDGNRYHGDYYMDGSDLDRVSEVASESLAEVLAAGEGKSYKGNVKMVAPDFAGIQEDPVAGPAWRMMMRDYKADLDRARKAIGKDSKGRTDGGIGFSSKAALNAIEADVFGAGKVVTKKTDLDTERGHLIDAFEAIEHYSNAQFNHNAALGPDGQDDDMNAPDEKAKNEKHWDAAAMRDRGLLGGALEAAKAYKAAVVTASASGGAVAPEELKLADEAVEAATQLLENVPAWYSLASTVTAYGKAKRAMRLMVPRLREARGHAHLGESDLPSVNAG
jgi:hypothetical protein